MALAEINTTLLDLAKWIPLLPLVALVVNGIVLGAFRSARKLAAVVTILAVAVSFALSLAVWWGLGDPAAFARDHGHYIVQVFPWIHIGDFQANFSYFIDPLTVVMLLVVTGVGLLISIYAAGYMAGDPGYYRFFAYIGLFIFTMTVLVLADNLLLLYLGWEGVGLSSYLLIGFYYRKPSARDAAKKAFIVNRVGDFGFALGLMGIFFVFGTVGFAEFLPIASGEAHAAATKSYALDSTHRHWFIQLIPFLLMLGAFGKSAQLPLHVWLPDAMEGPTPVSALIHAATMVTAGVYMIARLLPIFQLSEYALYTVAIVGGVTALFAATIALCQYDIKRIWAYSTISQLGYMFLGVGVLSTVGGVFHLFTHAFFKALLFLTAGSVMHALAGQLDLRKMSGLGRKMPITAGLMLIGCLALAGFPFTAGYYSKDMILAEALVAHPWLGWLGIVTALLTAFYTFRLWFRVFMGPTQYEMSHDHHGYPTDHPKDDHHGDHHGPHEMGWLMNGPLVLLAIGALVLGWTAHDWMGEMITNSTAGPTHFSGSHPGAHGEAHAEGGMDAHTLVSLVTGIGGIVMIALAGYFFWFRRSAADAVAQACGPVAKFLANKWYIDELYRYAIVLPLRAAGWLCYLFDRLVIDGLIVDGLLRYAPRAAAEAQSPLARGALQGVALAMAAGLFVVLVIVIYTTVM